jgi:hypothetical protein
VDWGHGISVGLEQRFFCVGHWGNQIVIDRTGEMAVADYEDLEHQQNKFVLLLECFPLIQLTFIEFLLF